MNDKWTFDGKGLGMPWAFCPGVAIRLSVQTGSDLEVSW